MVLLLGFGISQSLYAQTQSESRKVNSFSALEVSGPLEIILTESDRSSVTVEARSGYLDDIVTHVENGTLHIHLRKGHHNNIEGPLKVYVKANKLERIEASGAVKVYATNTLRMRDLDLNLSGATQFSADLRIESLEANISGASSLKLSGNAEQYEIEMSGASKIRAFDLPVKEGRLNMSGASHAEVHVHGLLAVEASGASSVVYDGDPQIKRSVSGMSSISNR